MTRRRMPDGIPPRLSVPGSGTGAKVQESILPYLEEYEDSLHRKEVIPPDQWLLEHIPDSVELRASLLSLYELYEGHNVDGSFPRIPGYQILGELGRGGMGVVYKACQTSLNRLVALKVVLAGQFASRAELHRFRREAETAARLSHTHIVRIHEVGEHNGHAYYSMELARGGSLDRRLAGTPLPAIPAARLIESLARAVQYAHEHNVVHRDLKPANVLLETAESAPEADHHTDGSAAERNNFDLQTTNPLLGDFGLAKRLDAEQGQTQKGALVGTASYMAPEQAQGPADGVGPLADVYGLGALLYEVLTGRPPFRAASFPETLQLVCFQDPVPPRRLQPKVPIDLETICLKCLEKEPRRRYASAEVLADDLRRFLEGELVWARPLGPLGKAVRWCWRKPLAASLMAVTLIVVALGVIAGASYWRAEVRRSLEAQTRPEIEVRNIIHAGRSLSHQRTGTRPADMRGVLEKLSEPRRLLVPSATRDRLDLEARSVYALSLGVPELLIGESDKVKLPWNVFDIWPVALHPSGTAMALGAPGRPLLWKRGEPFQAAQALDRDKPRPRLVYSPDGQFLVLTPPEGGLQLWDAELTRRMAVGMSGKVVLAVGFAADGKSLRVCCADGWFQSLSLPGLEDAKDGTWLGGKAGRWSAATFATDFNWLAVGDESGRVLLQEVDGRRSRELPSTKRPVEALAWSPNREFVAVGTKGGVVQLWSVEDSTPSFRWILGSAGVHALHFSPDGRRLLAGRGGDGMVWDISTGQLVLSLPATPAGFSRDGTSLALSDFASMAVAQLVDPHVIRALETRGASVSHVAWSRDERFLASLDSHFHVRVWDVGRGKVVDEFDAPRGGYWAEQAALALSDDGGLLAYAGGGPPGATDTAPALIRDVKAQTTAQRWTLPGGFEQLAYIAQGKFLLVREEDEGKGGVCRTVARELVPGKPADIVRVIRASEPGDGRRFFGHGLTPDGKYCWWAGPRNAPGKRRVEVREVSTGRLLTQVDRPNLPPREEVSASLSQDGRYLSVHTSGDWQLFDLADSKPPRAIEAPISAFAPGGRWLAFWHQRDHLRPSSALGLASWREGRSWLELGNTDQSDPLWAKFSSTGRYLAWGSRNGIITLVDLPALEEKVRGFEATVQGK